jgi:2-phosphoglycerate kinase
MSRVYFIGGTPRTGKTTLAMRFIKERPIFAVSADSIRYMLRCLYSPEEKPELFRFAKYISDDPSVHSTIFSDHAKAIAVQTIESAIVWHSVKSIVQSYVEDGHDILIEGIFIMPAFLDELDYEYAAIYLGNQSKQHADDVLKHARSHRDDWMYQLNDETILAFSELNISFSKHLEEEALKYGQIYIEMRDDYFEANLDVAMRELLK